MLHYYTDEQSSWFQFSSKILGESAMNIEQLFEMQRSLDQYIQENHQTGDTFRERGLALLVELSELANETRCFKFWSTKGPSANEVILEEYVDSIHFLLSLGIETGLDYVKEWPAGQVEGSDLTDLFLSTGKAVYRFLDERTLASYLDVWMQYGAIANSLGFTEEQIVQAYVNKNEENYARQRNGY